MNKLYMGIGLLIVLFLMFGPSTCNGVTYYRGISGCSTAVMNTGPEAISWVYKGHGLPTIEAPDHGSMFFDLINW